MTHQLHMNYNDWPWILSTDNNLSLILVLSLHVWHVVWMTYQTNTKEIGTASLVSIDITYL